MNKKASVAVTPGDPGLFPELQWQDGRRLVSRPLPESFWVETLRHHPWPEPLSRDRAEGRVAPAKSGAVPFSLREPSGDINWGASCMGKNFVVTLTEAQWQRVKAAVMDQDAEEALRLLREMVKQVEQQEARGLKSHLG